jgi:arsenate reductase
LCEAIARHLSKGRIDAFSAGSQPSGAVHPETLAQLQRRGIDTAGLASASWDSYAELAPDAVITVCDSAAGEQCPLWMGRTAKAHWGLPDPSSIEGSEEERAAAFDKVIRTIERRIARVLSLGNDELSGDALADALSRIAHEEA